MTRKDFKLIAGRINTEIDQQHQMLEDGFATRAETRGALRALESMARGICIELGQDNNLFDSERFLTACGIDKV